MNIPHMSRRTVLARTAVIAGTAIAATLPASHVLSSLAHAAGKDPIPLDVKKAVRRTLARQRRVLTDKPSHNGWEMERVADDGGSIFTRPVPGTPLTGIAVRMGDVEAVFVHLIRRFHYEIDELRKDDVVGWRSPEAVRRELPESNQASGTAVQIRPGHYPTGTRGGFYPLQQMVIRDILAELDGVIRWGGDDHRVEEALFYIDIKPGDSRLAEVANRVRGWAERADQGAGTPVDILSPSRRSAAKAMERHQKTAA